MDLNRLEQITIEDQLSKRECYDRIKRGFKALDIEDYISKAEQYLFSPKDSIELQKAFNDNRKVSAEGIVFKLLYAIGMAPEATMPLQNVIGQLEPILQCKEEVWDAVLAYYFIVELAGTYYGVEYNDEAETVRIRRNFEFPSELKEFCNQTMYLPPLICEPQEITGNRGSGYYSPLSQNDSIILGKGNHHDYETPIEVLNTLNAIPFSIDADALDMSPMPKEELDTTAKRVNWLRYVNGTRGVADFLLKKGNKFNFNHQLDFRYRVYSNGYHMGYQLDEWHKSLISLNKKEMITV